MQDLQRWNLFHPSKYSIKKSADEPDFCIRTYIIKEITASKGYDLDEDSHNVTVTKDQTVRADVNEVPSNDPNIAKIHIV